MSSVPDLGGWTMQLGTKRKPVPIRLEGFRLTYGAQTVDLRMARGMASLRTERRVNGAYTGTTYRWHLWIPGEPDLKIMWNAGKTDARWDALQRIGQDYLSLHIATEILTALEVGQEVAVSKIVLARNGVTGKATRFGDARTTVPWNQVGWKPMNGALRVGVFQTESRKIVKPRWTLPVMDWNVSLIPMLALNVLRRGIAEPGPAPLR